MFPHELFSAGNRGDNIEWEPWAIKRRCISLSFDSHVNSCRGCQSRMSTTDSIVFYSSCSAVSEIKVDVCPNSISADYICRGYSCRYLHSPPFLLRFSICARENVSSMLHLVGKIIMFLVSSIYHALWTCWSIYFPLFSHLLLLMYHTYYSCSDAVSR